LPAIDRSPLLPHLSGKDFNHKRCPVQSSRLFPDPLLWKQIDFVVFA